MKVLSVSLIALAGLVGFSSVQAQEQAQATSNPEPMQLESVQSGRYKRVDLYFSYDDQVVYKDGTADAAIELDALHNWSDYGEEKWTHYEPKTIQGLSYRLADRKIVYNDGTREVVCAEPVANRRGEIEMQNTGACELLVKEELKVPSDSQGRDQRTRRFKRSSKTNAETAKKKKKYDVYYLVIKF